ncbi:MAG: hypothetical protein OEU32_18660 [Acidimicrobiia bacterium]|nr:hypothetical protein [Acidimicrobiia bacterium]
MDLSDAVHAQHLAELALMDAAMQAEDFTTELLHPSDELPIASLLVALGEDDEQRQRAMSISIMPFDEADFTATQFIQFYVPIPFEVTSDKMGDLGHAIAIVNGAMALGHFGVRGNELFYRYMLAADAGDVISSEMLIELVSMMAFHQEHFADYLEGVLDGEIELVILPKLIQQSS